MTLTRCYFTGASFGRPVALALSTLALLATIAAAKPTTEIRVPPGFRCDLVYAPPLEVEGSWVALAVDQRGRLIASDQNGGLYRITPPPLTLPLQPTTVETIGLGIGMAQGLEVVDGKIYVMLNGVRGALTSGLYRITDDNGDDRYDRVEQLRVWNGGGEHGPHAVVLGPNGRSLYVCCGNMTQLPMYDRTRVPKAWQVDSLLPQLFSSQLRPGQMEPPGAWIARMDLNAELLEFYAAGYRNIYDIAFNEDGELFTFDSDNERDIGLPWYRPTRVCHVTSGVDMGWREGDGAFAPRAIDSLPAIVNVGPSSPTGMTFAKGLKFPAKYQLAMFAGDWSYGKIFAFYLHPDGSTYRGEFEQFASGMPLPVTDMVVNPRDGALYFVIGGREIETGVYRIAWVGPESDAVKAPPADPPAAVAAAAEARQTRKTLEALHIGQPEGAAEKAWPYLASTDPAIRSAARIVLEQQPIERWGEKALNESEPRRRLPALAALARVGAPLLADVWTESLRRIDFAKLSPADQVDCVRVASLGVLRLSPEGASRVRLVAMFDSHFPTGDFDVDGPLGRLLVRLESPTILPRLLKAIAEAPTFAESVEFARSASCVPRGWTLEQRRELLAWFERAAVEANAGSFLSLVEMRNIFLATFAEDERSALAQDLDKPYVQPINRTAAATVSRRFVRKWTIPDAIASIDGAGDQRDLARGKQLFAAVQCSRCHAVAGSGSSIGPDLTGVGGRLAVPDLMRSMIEPSATISDQYQQTMFTVNGRVITGRVSNMQGDEYYVSTDVLDPTKYAKFNREDIEDQRPSDISLMPTGLLDSLEPEELADLVAFLRSGAQAAQAPPQQ